MDCNAQRHHPIVDSASRTFFPSDDRDPKPPLGEY